MVGEKGRACEGEGREESVGGGGEIVGDEGGGW